MLQAFDESIGDAEAARQALAGFREYAMSELDKIELVAEKLPEGHPFWRINRTMTYLAEYASRGRPITDEECLAVETIESKRRTIQRSRDRKQTPANLDSESVSREPVQQSHQNAS